MIYHYYQDKFVHVTGWSGLRPNNVFRSSSPRGEQTSTLNPKPATLTPKPLTLNPEPFIPPPKTYTIHPEILHPETCTLHPENIGRTDTKCAGFNRSVEFKNLRVCGFRV